jgi:hypothetical protein
VEIVAMDYLTALHDDLIKKIVPISDYYLAQEDVQPVKKDIQETQNDSEQYIKKLIVIKNNFNKIQQYHSNIADISFMSLGFTNKRLFRLYINSVSTSHKEYLNTPFNLTEFRSKNRTYVYNWFWFFNTGIACLQESQAYFGHTIRPYAIEAETTVEKHYYQANYIRFDPEINNITFEFGRKYLNPSRFRTNTLLKALTALAVNKEDNLYLNDIIDLIQQLKRRCVVCNAGKQTFSDNATLCECSKLIRILLFIKDQLLADKIYIKRLPADYVPQAHGLHTRVRLVVDIPLPKDEIPLKLCYILRLI